MKLRDLHPKLTKCEMRVETWQQVKPGIDPLRGNWTDDDFHDVTGPRANYVPVETLAEADGIWFDCPCPTCQKAEHGPSRHTIGFEGRCPPDTYSRGSNGKDTRWAVGPTSTSLDDLVLTPSIQRVGGCSWHGFVGSSGVPPGEAQ